MTKDKLVEMVEEVIKKNQYEYFDNDGETHIGTEGNLATAIAERLREEGWVKNG